MKRTTLVFFFWLLSLPFSISLSSPKPSTSGSSKSAKSPPMPQITPVNCKLTLSFESYNNRICPLPTDASNPALFDGDSKLRSGATTYFCKITVEPNAPSSNFNAASYVFIWTKKGDFTTIKVPKEATSKLTVEFYENCNTCSANSIGRPYFRYTTTLERGQPFCDAYLKYFLTTTC